MFVFISYKSEDSNLVRAVAEQLIACGLDVWFNEYRILASDYERFLAGIDDGLSRATHAIVFTNDRWAEARWCNHEMDGLLEHIADRSHIIEVAIPSEDGPRKRYPDLLGRPPIIFGGDSRRPSHADVHGLVTAVLARLGFATNMTALPDSAPQPAWLPTPGLTFEPGPFRMDRQKTRRQAMARARQSDPVLGLRTVVYSLTAAGVDITMDVYATNFESPISRLSITDSGTSDDRAVYQSYLQYARRWLPSEHGHFRHVEYLPKGLHLVFVDGKSQIALTYVSKMENQPTTDTIWERRYAVRIPNPLADAKGELAFVFSVGLKGDEAQQMRAFCRLAPWFDAVVTSADIRWPSRLQSFVMAVPGALAKAALAAGFGWLGWDMIARHMPLWRLAVFAALVGVLAGDLGSYLFSSTYRSLLASLRPAVDDLRPIWSARRFISAFGSGLVTLGGNLLGLLVRGIIVAASYTIRYGALIFVAGWAAMFSKKALIAPPPWLLAHWHWLVLGAAASFGIAASQFTRAFVRMRYLKVPKKQEDGDEG